MAKGDIKQEKVRYRGTRTRSVNIRPSAFKPAPKTAEQLEEEKRRQEEWQKKFEEQQRERERIRREEAQLIHEEAQLTAGTLSPDVAMVFKRKEISGLPYGDYLDDPVATYINGHGWSEDQLRAVGLKMQITVSLDCSNSNWHNGVGPHAIAAFRKIGMAVELLKEQHPNDIFSAYFTFARNRDGKGVQQVRTSRFEDSEELGMWEQFRKTDMPYYAGEDTRYAPLFQAIERWEDNNSDPGAVCLDIVLTDGVFQYKKDLEECNLIQARRDGWKQTVFINFLPEDDEVFGATLPYRCTMMAVQPDQVDGILRQIISYFVTERI